MAKPMFLLVFCAFLITFTKVNSVQTNSEQNICAKCDCEEKTDQFENIPLININCARLEIEKCPSIEKFPTFIGHLDLSHNKITNLNKPVQLSSSTLYHLDFSFNRISSISDAYFQNLTQLIYLNLGHNKLKTIDKNIFNGLVNLKTLNLQSNKFKTLPENSFTQLLNLEEIILNYNNIGEFLENNKLSEHLPKSILSLNLDHINLKNISKGPFEELKHLKKLSIAFNPFTLLPSLELNNLEYLDISGTKIANLSTKSFMFPYLKVLKMNRLPYITKIYDYTFFNLHKLEEIYIEHCIRLKEMEPITFGYLQDKDSPNHLSLKKFSVAYSGLSYLPDTFQFIFQDLQEIYLRGNFWDCSCKVLWFLQVKKNVKDAEDIRCSSPESQTNKTLFSMTDEEFSCFQSKRISLPPGAPVQKWLFPVIGVLAIVILILVAILVYMGPYGQNIYKMEGKMIGPDSPYNPISIYPNQAEAMKL